MIEELKTTYKLSVNRACALVLVSKTTHYYVPKKAPYDEEIREYLCRLANDHKRWGFGKMMLKVKLEGKPWNHKRVYRIYCESKLNLRIKPRKRIPKGEAKALLQPVMSNVCWSIDFMSDALYDGRKFRTLNVIDDYNREVLLIEPSYSLPAARVTQLLDQVAIVRGYPEMIRVDNGPEFISATFMQWAKKHNVLIHHIQPGKPAQNGYIERLNRTYREDILDMNIFHGLLEVKVITKEWVKIYNGERPHESLAGLTPIGFINMRKTKIENSLSK